MRKRASALTALGLTLTLSFVGVACSPQNPQIVSAAPTASSIDPFQKVSLREQDVAAMVARAEQNADPQWKNNPTLWQVELQQRFVEELEAQGIRGYVALQDTQAVPLLGRHKDCCSADETGKILSDPPYNVPPITDPGFPTAFAQFANQFRIDPYAYPVENGTQSAPEAAAHLNL